MYGLVALGVIGAALFYGDGMITPAISVLSAVEGLELVAPSLGSLVIPITLAILTTLFIIQRFGTGVVGRLFGPVMGAWFAALAVLGLIKVVGEPSILRALSPHYGVSFFLDESGKAFLVALPHVVQDKRREHEQEPRPLDRVAPEVPYVGRSAPRRR